jgi:hypothetical protein
VPNLWDKTPEAPFPSELNPLTNPVLEQNLGRWAKVYFSAPPAKRDQAVSNLLEEIKRESGTGAPGRSARPYFATDARFERPVCSACQHHNPPGHKFCSRCGQVLSPGQTATPEIPRIREAVESPLPSPANDVGWVREQTFSGLTDGYAQPGRGWKYLVGMAVIVMAGLAYFYWTPEFRTRVAPTATPQMSAPAEAAALPQEKFALGDAGGQVEKIAPASLESTTPAAQRPSPTAEAHRREVVPTGIQPAVQKSRLLDATNSRQTFVGQESGAPDLRLAQRYLEGSMGVRDPSEAAKLLWKSVRKQNATAAILLSDLYLRGDGVPRSCDEARLLLVAAAKRGSPQAAQQLRNVESQGCQ